MHKILHKTKKCFHSQDIQTIKLPKYEEFSLSSLMEVIRSDPELN